MIDIVSINDEGGLLDAAALASYAALKTAKFPKVEDGKVNYEEKTDESLPLGNDPIAVTVYKIGDNLIVDPLTIEEGCYDSRLTVTTIGDGIICSLQKGGDAPLTIEEIDQMVTIAKEKAGELRSKL